MTWAIVLAAGCSKASPTTPTPSCASSDSCNSTDSQLRACASFATGLYGTASVSCAAGPCPAPDEACASGELDVTGSTGAKTVTPIPSSGSFATALAAGTYQVCAKAEEGSVCIALVLAPGTLLRVDVGTEESPGGDYTQVSVQGTQVVLTVCDDGGTCGALLPSGSFCVFGYVCASGTCTNSACE